MCEVVEVEEDELQQFLKNVGSSQVERDLKKGHEKWKVIDNPAASRKGASTVWKKFQLVQYCNSGVWVTAPFVSCRSCTKVYYRGKL